MQKAHNWDIWKHGVLNIFLFHLWSAQGRMVEDATRLHQVDGGQREYSYFSLTPANQNAPVFLANTISVAGDVHLPDLS